MRRAPRLLLNAATTLSLLLCVAVLLLWIGGTRMVRTDRLISRDASYEYFVAYGVLDGRLVLGRYCHCFEDSVGNCYVPDTSIRCAWVCLATLLLPGITLFRSVRKRPGSTATTRLCRTCGYDLRATPDRCPECGRLPNSESAGTGAPPYPDCRL